MKLKINTFESKGNTYTNYVIGKINDFGQGLLADKPLKGTFAFEPRIRKGISYIDKKDGSQCTFDSITASINVTNLEDFENLEVNDYGSATFQLPSRFVEEVEKFESVKNRSVEIVLKSFEDSEGKMKTVWEMKIGDIVPFSKPEDTETVGDEVKTVSIKPSVIAKVQEAFKDGKVDNDKVIKVEMTDGSVIPMKVVDVLRG